MDNELTNVLLLVLIFQIYRSTKDIVEVLTLILRHTIDISKK